MNLDLIFESQEVRLAMAGYFLLSEAINISEKDAEKYAAYIKRWDKRKYAQWFGDEERITIPLEKEEEDKKIVIPHRVQKAMDILGYKITDYYAGTCSKDGKNIEKIGRVLKKNEVKLKDEGFEEKTYKGMDKDGKDKTYQMLDVIHDFDFDRNRGARKDPLVVVISRHPLDLAKMSEGRKWQKQSCMAMGGDNHHYVWCDIDEGTLVAYATKSSDKDLENPVGRVLIKPYINRDNPQDILLVNTKMVHGANPAGFLKVVDEWLDSVQGNKEGVFKLNTKLYHDRPGHGQGEGPGAPKVVGGKDEYDFDNISPSEALEFLVDNFSEGEDADETLDPYLRAKLQAIMAEDPNICVKWFKFLGGGVSINSPWDEINKDVLDSLTDHVEAAEQVFELSPLDAPDQIWAAVTETPHGAVWAVDIMFRENSDYELDDGVLKTILEDKESSLELKRILNKNSIPLPKSLTDALDEWGAL